MDITVYISYTKNIQYLDRCLKIIEGLKFFNDVKVNLDGWKAPFVDHHKTNPVVDRIYTHAEGHGSRYYSWLRNSDTERVMFFDSDFLCSDNSFWEKAWLMSGEYPLVSIGRKWHWGLILPSTPFLILRKDLLGVLPERALWDHFGRSFPEIPDPLFDNMQYLFLLVMKRKMFGCVDVWYPLGERIHKFYHLWGSLSTPQEDIDRYYKTGENLFLGRWVCKIILLTVLNEKSLDIDIWTSVDKIVSMYPHHTSLDLLDLFRNVQYQLGEKEMNQLKAIKNDFYSRYPAFRTLGES